jgi:hypothetical protein
MFVGATRTVVQLLFDLLHLSRLAIFRQLTRALRPLLLTASALCFTIFLFFVLTIRQAYFLDEPLVEAAGHGDLATARTLLSRGASPDAYGMDSTTALVYASTYGQRDVVVLLLCAGASPTLRDSYGQLPVEAAAENGHDEIARLLQDRSMAFCKN